MAAMNTLILLSGGLLLPLKNVRNGKITAVICTKMDRDNFYPVRACAARGKVISRGWWCPYIKKSTVFLEPIFYLSKYSLSELYLYTDRLLIEFNGLWYSLAARQVFVAIANPDSLLFG